jgi:hypothetical protein
MLATRRACPARARHISVSNRPALLIMRITPCSTAKSCRIGGECSMLEIISESSPSSLILDRLSLVHFVIARRHHMKPFSS